VVTDVVNVDDDAVNVVTRVARFALALKLEVNEKILSALRLHHAPVTRFVVQKGVEDLGPTAANRIVRANLQNPGDPDRGQRPGSITPVQFIEREFIFDQRIRRRECFWHCL
jgi:hypothetical protein